MKLPDIEYDRSMVQESSGAIGRLDQARRQALDVLSSGFQAFGQELIKTQTEKAAADVEAGLAADEADLASKRYLPLAAVKEEMGDGFTTLPPEVQNHRQLVDDGQGGQVEVVPTYLVAGALFDKRAKDRIQQASEGISAQGWQASFQTAALNDLTQRKRKLAMAQAGAALDDFKQTQLATVDQYVRGRAWDQALGTIDRSQALSEGEKATKREDVLAARQKDEATTAKVQAAAQVEATSSGILQAARIPGYDWIDPAKALAAVEKMPDSDPAKDDVRKLVEHQVRQAEQLRELVGREKMNEAQALINKGVPLASAQMAPLKAWMLDPANGSANYWDALERGVAAEARASRAERNDRLAQARAAEADARRAAADQRQAEADARRQAKEEADQQKALDTQALADFDALPLKGEQGKDQMTGDLAVLFPDSSPLARSKMQARQRKASEAWAKDQGVNVGEFKAKVDSASAGLGYSKADVAKFRTYMLEQYLSRPDPSKPLPPEDAAKMLADAVTYADVKWGSDVPAWKLRMQGKDATPAAEQPERVRAVIAAKTVPASSPTVLVQYGEKRLRIPRTRLSEALKDGAQEIQ